MLVGCGNIGFRHLQAMCDVPTPLEIVVVEPNAEHHDRIEGQFASAAHTQHRFELTRTLPERSGPLALVVVATTAAQRRRVIDDVLARFKVVVMIFEKILFQTERDLEEVGSMLETVDVNAFVNCGRRTFDGYREIREQLERPIDVTVDGQQLGLASNMVHFLDLVEYLNDAALTTLDGAGLVPGFRHGKRPGEIEIFGAVAAHLDNGATLRLTSLDQGPMRVDVLLTAADGRVVAIDELARQRLEGGEVAPFDAQNVSEAVEVYEDAVNRGRCSLTPYADSVRQHQLFLSVVRKHLGLAHDEPCPVS